MTGQAVATVTIKKANEGATMRVWDTQQALNSNSNPTQQQANLLPAHD